jgi:histone deacetylase 11
MIVRQLRAEKRLLPDDAIAYIDLDAHQGNGVCHQFRDDSLVRIFDMYNRDIYPRDDIQARDRIDCKVPLEFNCTGAEYLRLLRERLPVFLDGWTKKPRLCIYNAGTDPFVHDRLGGLCLSEEDILDRDLFVFEQLAARKIPVVMLLSGGYSKQSYRLVAATVNALLQTNRRADYE